MTTGHRLGLSGLFTNVLATMGRQLGAGLLQLAILVVITRIYGPEGNGAYSLALLLPATLGTMLNLGISPANVYFIGSGKVSARTALLASFKLGLIIGTLGVFIGSVIIVNAHNQLFPQIEANYLWLALSVFPVSLAQGFISSIFQGLQLFGIFNLALLLQPSITLGLIVLVSIFIDSASVLYLIGAYFAGYVATISVMLMLLRPHLGRSSVRPFELKYISRAIGYGSKAHLSNILAFVNYKADIFLVNWFINPAAAGVYVVAVGLAEKLWQLSQAVSTVLLPRLAELSTDEITRKLLTPLVCRWMLLSTGLGSIVLSIVAAPLIYLAFGENFSGAVSPLLILLPGMVSMSASRVMANDIAARGRPELNMYTSSIVVLVNILGNIALIPRYGLDGAATATTIAYSLNLPLRLFIYCRLSGNTWNEPLFIKPEDMALLSSIKTKHGSSQSSGSDLM